MTRMLSSRAWKLTGAAGIALLVLLVGVFVNRYRFETLPFRPHLEQFALLVVGAALVWLVLKQRARISFQKSDLLLAAYLVFALVSSLLFPPEPRESVQYWARMVLAVAVFFLARWLLQGDADRVRLIVAALLVIGVLEAAFGIVSWFLYPLGINLGVDEYPLGLRGPTGVPCNLSLTMYGTLWEPNVYASTLMLIILLGATLFFSDAFKAGRKSLAAALVIMLLAMGLNASRGALLMLALGFGLVLLWTGGVSFARKLKYALGAALLVVVVMAAGQETARVLMQLPSAPGLAARAPCAAWIAVGMPNSFLDDPEFATGPDSDFNVVNRVFEGQTLASRFVSYTKAWQDFLQRPLLGNGANSFGQKYTTTAHTPGWISNLLLMSLHDTGILGTAFLLAWFAWFAWARARVLRSAPPSAQRTMALGLGIGLLCLFLAYQVTTMVWFGLPWYLMAVMEGATS